MKRRKNFEFVQIPNEVVSGNSKNGATPDGIRVYFALLLLEARWFHGATVTIDLLHGMMKEIFYKKENDNKNAIRDALYELKAKGFIAFIQESVSHTELIEVSFNNPQKNFIMMNADWFDYIDDNEQLAVMCLIYKLQNLTKEIPYDLIADVTYRNKRSIQSLVERMEKKGLISTFKGGVYKNEQDQWRNHIIEFTANEDKIERFEFKGNENVQQMAGEAKNNIIEMDEPETMTNSVSYDDTKLLFDTGLWYEKDAKGSWKFLKYEDYKLYRDKKDINPSFDEHCEKRMEQMKRGKFDFSQWEQKYDQETKAKKQGEQVAKEMQAVAEKEMVESLGRELHYVPKQVRDMSKFLDD